MCVCRMLLKDLPTYTYVLNSSPPHATLSISMQIWTNYETHIFKMWGYVPPDLWLPGSAIGYCHKRL